MLPELSTHQKEALDRIKKFLRDDDQDVFILNGYAGTGKTTLIGHILQEAEKMGMDYYVGATTGRAAKVLEDKLESVPLKHFITYTETGRFSLNEMVAGGRVNFGTVHGHIYTPVRLDVDPKSFKNLLKMGSYLMKHPESLFDESQEDETIYIPEELKKEMLSDESSYKMFFGIRVIAGRKLFIVDESSMISDVYNEDNKSHAVFGSGRLLNDLFKAFPHAKFIFVGDEAQLPPVGSHFNYALSKKYLEEEYGLKVDKFTLSEIHRTAKGNGIIKASAYLRWQTENDTGFRTFFLNDLPNINVMDTSDLIMSYASELKRAYMDGKDEGLYKALQRNILIALRNRVVHSLNREVRRIIFGEEADWRKIRKGDILMVTQNNYLYGLWNGDFVQVTSEPVFFDKRAKLRFLSVTVKNLNTNQEIDVKLIENILGSGSSNISGEQYKNLMRDFIIRFHNNHKNDTRTAQQGLDEIFMKELANDEYVNALRAVHGYVITAHKSQGGEWDNVHVLLEDLLNWEEIKAYNWVYTAITRAKSNLNVAGYGIASFTEVERHACRLFPELCEGQEGY